MAASTTDAPRPRAATLAREAGVFLLFAAWAVVVTRPLAFRATTHTLAGPDPLSHLWMVSWLTGHALEPSQLFQGNIFHPAPHAVLFTDLSLGTAILVLPFRLLTTEPLVLFNVATLLALAFGGWAFHFLAYSLTRNRWAALLTGLLAAFSTHQMSHVYHLNLLSIGWLALLLLGLHRILVRPSAGAAILAGVAFALNAQSSGYYAVAATVLALVFAAFHARALLERRRALAALGAASLAVLLTLPYIHEFGELQEEEDVRRPPGMSRSMSFQPARDLSSAGYLYSVVLGSDGERLFPGVLPLVLLIPALRRDGREARSYAGGVLVLLLLSLGPQLTLGRLAIPLPYAALFAIPPLDSMRHPYTFAAVAWLLLAVLAGLGWSRLAAKAWSGPAILALAVAETLTWAPVLRPITPGLPPAYELLKALPPGPVLEVPVFAPETVVWAARHGWPVINGIGAFAPARTMVLERYVMNHWVDDVPGDVDTSRPMPYLLERFPVRYVVIPTGRKRGFRRLGQAFDRSHLFRLVAVAEDGDRIYEVQPPAAAP